MRYLSISIIFIMLMMISLNINAQSYIWEENFTTPPAGWDLQANWSFTSGYMQLHYSPTIENYDLSATSPEIYIPENAGDLHITQWVNYFSYQNEAFEIALLVGDQVNVLWTHSGSDWGSSGGQLLTIPLNDYQNQTGRIRFRSFGASTWNINYWRIYHVGIEGTTGSLNGHVYDQDNNAPLGNTTITILNTNFETTTNTSGYFSLTGVPTGTYDVSAHLVGYDLVIQEDVLIEENQTTTIDFYLEELDFITVSGQVVGSDYPEIGLAGATVSFSGYNTYDTVTGTNGLFSIPGVYCGQTYYITVNATGYATYNGELTVGEDNLDIGAIIVNEIAYPPQSIVAALGNDHSYVNVSWQLPSPGSRQGSNRLLEAYIVFRFPYEELEDEGNWTELATVEESSYDDTEITALPDGTYGYAVRSLYTNNVISEPEFSNPVEYEEVFPNITNLQAIQEGMDVYLSWEWLNNTSGLRDNSRGGSNRDLLGFSITRNGAVIAEDVMDLSYTDTGLSPGTYSYTVIGTFTNGNTNMLFTEIDLLSSEIGNLAAVMTGRNVQLTWEWIMPETSAESDLITAERSERETERNFLGFTVTRNDEVIADGIMQTLYIDEYVLPGLTVYTVTGYFSDGETNTLETEIDVPIPQITNPEAVVIGNDIQLSWEWLTSIGKNNRDQYILLSSLTSSSSEFFGFTITRNDTVIAEGIQDTGYIDEDLSPGTYHYTIVGIFSVGETNTLELEVEITTSVEGDEAVIPLTTRLQGNYPNPFNPETTISYSIEQEGMATIEIYNINGQLVRTLVRSHHTPGEYSVIWTGEDNQDRKLRSGVYLYRMKSGKYISTKKMLILK